MMHRSLPGDNKLDPVEFLDITSRPVSYTHLTLPTIYTV